MHRYTGEEVKDLWREAHDRLLVAVLAFLYAKTPAERERALDELVRLAEVHVSLDKLIG